MFIFLFYSLIFFILLEIEPNASYIPDNHFISPSFFTFYLETLSFPSWPWTHGSWHRPWIEILLCRLPGIWDYLPLSTSATESGFLLQFMLSIFVTHLKRAFCPIYLYHVFSHKTISKITFLFFRNCSKPSLSPYYPWNLAFQESLRLPSLAGLVSKWCSLLRL